MDTFKLNVSWSFVPNNCNQPFIYWQFQVISLFRILKLEQSETDSSRCHIELEKIALASYSPSQLMKKYSNFTARMRSFLVFLLLGQRTFLSNRIWWIHTIIIQSCTAYISFSIVRRIHVDVKSKSTLAACNTTWIVSVSGNIRLFVSIKWNYSFYYKCM